MLFHEIYGAYYATVTHIIEKALTKELNGDNIKNIIQKYAFDESLMTILPALTQGQWPFIHQDFSTPLKHMPTRPLTILEKRWLKTISLDPRIQLFDVDFSFLNDIEPLFTDRDFCIYDKYSDGDSYQDSQYIRHFRIILQALKQISIIDCQYLSQHGHLQRIQGLPLNLEFSQKDDKFRLNIRTKQYIQTLNVANIQSCKISSDSFKYSQPALSPSKETVLLLLKNERNALERALLHFAHFEKRVEQVDDNTYHLQLTYPSADHHEMIIRILSFGPLLQVISPENMIKDIKNKLILQKSCEK